MTKHCFLATVKCVRKINMISYVGKLHSQLLFSLIPLKVRERIDSDIFINKKTLSADFKKMNPDFGFTQQDVARAELRYTVCVINTIYMVLVTNY